MMPIFFSLMTVFASASITYYGISNGNTSPGKQIEQNAMIEISTAEDATLSASTTYVVPTSVSVTESPPSTISLTPTPSIRTELSKTPTPERKDQPSFSMEKIYEFTERYGAEFGIDPNIIRHVVRCESGMNPAATNLGYAGLFQFDSRTWQTYRGQMRENTDPDLRLNAEEAIKTGAYALSKTGSGPWQSCYPK